MAGVEGEAFDEVTASEGLILVVGVGQLICYSFGDGLVVFGAEGGGQHVVEGEYSGSIRGYLDRKESEEAAAE